MLGSSASVADTVITEVPEQSTYSDVYSNVLTLAFCSGQNGSFEIFTCDGTILKIFFQHMYMAHFLFGTVLLPVILILYRLCIIMYLNNNDLRINYITKMLKYKVISTAFYKNRRDGYIYSCKSVTLSF